MSHPNPHSLTRKLVHDGVAIEGGSDIAVLPGQPQLCHNRHLPVHFPLLSLQSLDIMYSLTHTE